MPSSMPWTKWFYSDWLADAGVRGVSSAARGLWMDMLALMYGSPRRGYLLEASGKPMTTALLAKRTGCTVTETKKLLQELGEHRVYSTEDDGTIYSRRMVRDEERRLGCSENGKKGGSPLLKNAAAENGLSQPLSQGLTDDTQKGLTEPSGVCASTASKHLPSEECLAIYAAYPRKVGKGEALKSIERALRSVSFDVLMEAVQAFAKSDKGMSGRFCPNPATWFNQERWNDDRSTWNDRKPGAPRIGAGQRYDPTATTEDDCVGRI